MLRSVLAGMLALIGAEARGEEKPMAATVPAAPAVRLDDWKAIRLGTTKPIALYDLKSDLGETNNVAAQHPDVVRKVETILKTARTDNAHWKINEKGIPGVSPFAEDKK